MLAQAPSARETKLAKSLVHPEKTVRDRTLQTLSSYVGTLSDLDDKEMMKLWKALYYCMWLADKSEVQLELANSLANLVDKMSNEEVQTTYFRNFFRIMLREWSYLDQYRVNKFYVLIRVVVNKIFTIIANKNFDHTILCNFGQMINDEVLKRLPNGIRYHMCDIYFSELAKVGGESIATSTLLVALEPFFDSVTRPLEEGPFVERVYRSVFNRIVTEQADSFPHVKWTALQKKVFDLASAEETPERHRKKLYELHKLISTKTGVQFVTEDEPVEEQKITKSKKADKKAEKTEKAEKVKAAEETKPAPVKENTEVAEKKSSKKRNAEEEEAPVAKKAAEPEPVATKPKEVATPAAAEQKKKQKKESSEEPVKTAEPVAEKDGKKKKEKAAKDEESSKPPAAAATPKAEEQAKPDFVESKKFAGAKPGYIFQKGPRGIGYYIDKNRPAPKAGKSQKKK